MTSKQQVKQLYANATAVKADRFILIKVEVEEESFYIGYGVREYRAFRNAMKNLGLKVIFGKGVYMKDILNRVRNKTK